MGAPGFDDSPVWAKAKADLPKPITLVYPYYENPIFFRYQLSHWSVLPAYMRDLLRVVVVDDGSPDNPAIEVLREMPLPFVSLYRIDVDVRWNWIAARNIGMHHAVDGWCVLTDMDHVVPMATIDQLMSRWYDPGMIYRFSRSEHTGQPIHPHPNSMFMTREMFWKIGGYDESLSGYYGTDGDWRRRCAATAPVRLLTQVLMRHEHLGDSSTKRYLRKQPEDAGKRAIIAKRTLGWRPKVLSFPYHKEEL